MLKEGSHANGAQLSIATLRYSTSTITKEHCSVCAGRAVTAAIYLVPYVGSLVEGAWLEHAGVEIGGQGLVRRHEVAAHCTGHARSRRTEPIAKSSL